MPFAYSPAPRAGFRYAALLPVLLLAACGWVDEGVGGNRPPVTDAADYRVPVGGVLEVDADNGVLAEASDGGNRPLTARLVEGEGPQHAASFTFNADGSFSYTHDGGPSTQDSFSYVANDGIDDSAPTPVLIRITHPPVAEDDGPYKVTGGELTVAASQGLLSNDADPDTPREGLTAVLEQGPAHGTLNLSADGGFTYRVAGGGSGQDSFTYRATDGESTSAPATVTLTINARPIARDDGPYTVRAGRQLTVSAGNGVLANDSDADGEALTARLVDGPRQAASFTLHSNGGFTYAHEGGADSSDSFTYVANDGTEDSAPATVRITITLNQRPVAEDDQASTSQNVPVTIAVTSNDFDPDGSLQPGSVTIASAPSHGSALPAPGGNVLYTPQLGFSGTDEFTYTVRDNEGAVSAPGTVTVTVRSNNQTPVARNDSATTDENTPVTILVIDNDFDPDGGAVNGVIIASSPAHGTATASQNGSVTYTPDPGFAGTDQFTYTARDDEGTTSNPATVTITVRAVNQAPVAADDSADTTVDAPVTIQVLANDSDPDGTLQPGSVRIVNQPAQGSATVNGDGSITYTPVVEGQFEFRYAVSDNDGASATARVSVRVRAGSDDDDDDDDEDLLALSLSNDSYTVTYGETLSTGADTGVLANDERTVAEEGQSESLSTKSLLTVATSTTAQSEEQPDLRAEILEPPRHGTLVLNQDGSFVYTHAGDTAGADVFTYRALSGDGRIGTARVDIAINTAPRSEGGCWDTPQNVPLRARLPALDRETPALLMFAVETGPEQGVLEITDPTRGLFEYRADATAQGTDRFSYRVQDPAGAATSASGRILIHPRIMPLGDSLTAGTAEDGSYRPHLQRALSAAGHSFDFVGSQTQAQADYDADHEGHAGWSAFELAYGRSAGDGAYAWLQRTPADVVLLQAAAADTAAGARAVLEEIDRWAADTGRTLSILLALAPVFAAEDLGATASYNEQLRSLAAERPQTVLVDLPAALHDGTGTVDPRYLAGEGALNAAGHEAAAGAWFAQLRERLTACPPTP